MNEQRADFELLQDFARQGNQQAFAALVDNHLSLVYTTALRKVANPSTAEEICQNVFLALAHKAWRFARYQSLPAWLHRATILECTAWWRRDLRRRRREEIAVELGTTMNEAKEQNTSSEVITLLDEALLSLREKDRAALLLRYYERKAFREVGIALGLGENAAQKRVTEAVVKLERFFQRKGFKTVSAAAISAGLQQTTTSAPPVLAISIVQAVTPVGTAVLFPLKALAAKALSLTKGQTATFLLATALAFAIWRWGTHSTDLGSPSFSATGKIIETSGRQTNIYSFEIDVVGRTWYLRLLAPADVAHLLYDGTNQYVVSFPIEDTPRKILPALVHNSAIPYGGSHLQTLWIAFCGDAWKPMKHTPFVNLQTFQKPPVRTNANLHLISEWNGRIRSASLTFSNRSEEFPIEDFVFSKWTNIGTAAVPLSFSRQFHSRLGVEHVKGKITQPPSFKTTRSYDEIIERHDVLVESVSPRSHKPLRLRSTEGLVLRILDQRFANYGNWVSYESSNRFLTKGEVQADPKLARKIRKVIEDMKEEEAASLPQ